MAERIIDGYTLHTGVAKIGTGALWVGTIGVKSADDNDVAVHSLYEAPSASDDEAYNYAAERLKQVVGIDTDLKLVFQDGGVLTDADGGVPLNGHTVRAEAFPSADPERGFDSAVAAFDAEGAVTDRKFIKLLGGVHQTKADATATARRALHDIEGVDEEGNIHIR